MLKGAAHPHSTSIFGEGWGARGGFYGAPSVCTIPLLVFYELNIHSSETEVWCLLEDSIPGLCRWGRKYMED